MTQILEIRLARLDAVIEFGAQAVAAGGAGRSAGRTARFERIVSPWR